ncbi:MAG: NADH-quinone oxidoreductase subunit NuoF [Candidatus Heimdallarchaeota archaeon]|nr:NADH-quinone oxidoreductase subunit NuoF [Candidatus Heimdallarchaeota archaeon]
MNKTIRICMGTGCISSKADEVKDKFDELAEDHDVEISGCHGFCSQGPIVVVDDVFYSKVQNNLVGTIIDSHLTQDIPVNSLFYKSPLTNLAIAKYRDIPFYSKQTRIVLANCGNINPEKIDEYINIGGYTGLKIALKSTPEEVIEDITKSGLRGRGGAGFPTGMKWNFARRAYGTPKYVIINADEGDPGAFMDRSILEADPHSVIEGLIIGAYAIGAPYGIIYVRAEYPLAVIRFNLAIEQARDRGYLGENILGSNFSFNIEVYEGAGAFVCGEETALIKSIEGGRGNPVVRPPFPATSGLWGKPTNINNVKTWSAVAWIMRNGWEKFSDIGTESSSGTAIFSLTGKVNNSGLIEVPMGTTLREIIYEIGGGIEDGKILKAIQTGGPSGGCIPASLIDTPVDYETMAKVGSIMGSGGMVVIDEDTCIVDFAKFFLRFTQEESCGKCTPCREGTLRALQILERITHGDGKVEDLDELETLSEVIRDTSLCGLGMTAPNPVLSTMKYFRDEYLEHILEHRCVSGVCPGLFKLKIDQDACRDCGICQKNCSFDAIRGNKEDGFVIIDEYCTQCKNCIAVCPADSINIVE